MFSAPKLHRVVYYFMLPMFWLLKEYVVWGEGVLYHHYESGDRGLHLAALLLVHHYNQLRVFFPRPTCELHQCT